MEPSSPLHPSPEITRAIDIKDRLTQLATSGDLKKEYELETEEEENEDADASAGPAQRLDWFLFEWTDDYGMSAIDHFMEAETGLSDDEREMLDKWNEVPSSVYEVRSAKGPSFKLRDLQTEDDHEVHLTPQQDPAALRKGQFLVARLLPTGGGLILSGGEFHVPNRKAAEQIAEMMEMMDEITTPETDEEIEERLRVQRGVFIQLFGADEHSIPVAEFPATVKKFFTHFCHEYRDPVSGMTAAELFRQESGGEELEIPDIPPFEKADGITEITLCFDEFDGLQILPEYGRFKQVFESKDTDAEVPGWRDLVWMYVESPDIPIVAFERVAERSPKRVEKVLRDVLDDQTFSLEHLYALLLHYKQPVEGLEDLEDDEMLWDLLDGGGAPKPIEAEKSSKPVKGAKGSAAKPGSAKTKSGEKAPAKSGPGTEAKSSAKRSKTGSGKP